MALDAMLSMSVFLGRFSATPKKRGHMSVRLEAVPDAGQGA